MRIGIDVGGTNTDAALMDGRKVLATSKQQTTADVTAGVVSAFQSVLDASRLDRNQVDAVMVGTTHFVNAFVQRRDLNPVAILRVALPMTSGISPLVDWPDDLRSAIGEHVFLVEGGSYYTGMDYIDLDEGAIEAAGREIKKRELTSVAITSVFAPIRPDLETRAQEIVRRVAGEVDVTLSHQVGGIGLIERENAAVINASLQSLSRRVIQSLKRAMQELSLDARLFFSQNDGTLMSADYAERFPVMTCSAGPTNSIRGAAFLSGLKDAVVVDIGGTTTDVGVLSNGFPRETAEASEIGGVRTNFSMPDVLSVALGGGTVVRFGDDGAVELGPDSVGFRLLEKGRAFGGDTLTTTDIAIARGAVALGDPERLTNLSDQQCAEVSHAVRARVESAIDQLKTSAAPVPVILVGGGSILVDDELRGASELVTPADAPVANAIGAAIAQVGGRVKRLFDFGAAGGREAALEQAVSEARQNAVEAGARAETLEVVGMEEFPMTHMQTDTVDVHVRVVGELED